MPHRGKIESVVCRRRKTLVLFVDLLQRSDHYRGAVELLAQVTLRVSPCRQQQVEPLGTLGPEAGVHPPSTSGQATWGRSSRGGPT